MKFISMYILTGSLIGLFGCFLIKDELDGIMNGLEPKYGIEFRAMLIQLNTIMEGRSIYLSVFFVTTLLYPLLIFKAITN